MDDIDFTCTMCGNCCHDLRLPLTVDEATAWIERGGQVQVLCEALPWLEEPGADNPQAQHKRRRSFAATSGTLPARVIVVLAGTFAGPCPNLGPDMRCGIYESRPMVCRIYPAEINPFVPLVPSHKGCPPEAWAPSRPYVRRGAIVDAELRELIARSRRSDELEAPLKREVCVALGIDKAAVSNEGFVAHAPQAAALHAALTQARTRASADLPDDAARTQTPWSFVSNQRKTVDVLVSVGALGEFVDAASESQPVAYEYLGFLAPSA